jgi:putative MATE family efflux protein
MSSDSPPQGAREATVAAPLRWIQLLRAAISGSESGLTDMSLRRAVILLAVPMVLEMSMESLFAICDVFFVAKLGAEPVAVIGLCEGLMAIVYALGMGIAMPATALVARRMGEAAPERAAQAAVQAIALGVLVGGALSIPAAWLAPDLLTLMGASDSVVAIGTNYARFSLASSVIIVLLFVCGGIFRGAGDAAMAMRALWLANLINIVLDPCLIFGVGPFPELGLTGAGAATLIGRSVGVGFFLYKLTRPGRRIQVRPRDLRVAPPIIAQLARLGVGATGQYLIETSSWVLLVRIVAIFGSSVLAGYTIATRVLVFALLPAWGLSNAAATLVGQNLGAGKPERAEKSVWITGTYNMLFLALVSIAFLLSARPIVGIFTTDPNVLRVGSECLTVMSYGYVFYAWGMVLLQAFNGAGDTTTPMFVNLGCFWGFKLPCAYIAAKTLGLGPQGVYWAVVLAYSLSAVVSFVIFRRGRWKTVTI